MKVLIAINPSHSLTKSQLAELEGFDWKRLEDVDANLAQKLANLTDQNVEKSYWEFSSWLMRLSDQFDAVVLPIGSPAFQFRFALELGLCNDPMCLDKFFFAHTERKTVEVEKDGTVQKASVFEHQRFFNLRGVSLRALPIII
jgi:hypothetical protein